MSDIVRQAAGTTVVCRSAIEVLLDVIGNKQVLCVTRVDVDQFRLDTLIKNRLAIDQPPVAGILWGRQTCRPDVNHTLAV